MKTKTQPQPKFFVNDKDFTKETEALSQLEALKASKTPKIVYTDVKAKTKTTYTLNRKNYYVDAEVYTPKPSNTGTTADSNDRDNADILLNVQPTAE